MRTFATDDQSGQEAGPRNVITADFNGDRLLDLAVGSTQSELAVLLGDGTGDFDEVLRHEFEDAHPYFAISAGDFDEDGLDDLVVTHAETSILFGQIGGGDPRLEVVEAEWLPSRSVAAADFDSNGHRDLEPWFTIVGASRFR